MSFLNEVAGLQFDTEKKQFRSHTDQTEFDRHHDSFG